jgi:outer membrane protein TolC
MNLSWSVLVLALMGAKDQPASQTSKQGSPIPVGSDVNVPGMVSSESGLKAVATIAVPPGVSTAATAAPASASKLASSTKDAESGVRLARTPASPLPEPLPGVEKSRTLDDPEVELWPMTLREAYRIALDNDEMVRVITLGVGGLGTYFVPTAVQAGIAAHETDAGPVPIVIAWVGADASLWRFKAEVMARIRSVEQLYWGLAQAHNRLWAADRTLILLQDVLQGEQAKRKTGRGTTAAVDEVAQRIEHFKLDLVDRTSDVIKTERQLRNRLGLPPSDNRRIIPVTPPTEGLIEYDWDACLGAMMDNQPDIVQQKVLIRVAELRLLIARNQLLPQLGPNTLYQFGDLGQQLDAYFVVMTKTMLEALNPLISGGEKAVGPITSSSNNGFSSWQTGYYFYEPMGGRGPLHNSRQAQYILLRSRAYLNQIERQTTHSLARSFGEVDANYKQNKTSSRLRDAATRRLDAYRASYEGGRISIDRLLDAISQYTTAAATEAQCKATYTLSLAALAEAKGTLLAERDIVIAEGTHPVKAYSQTAKSRAPMPHAVPAIAAIPQDLRTISSVAGLCAAMMPQQALEESRVMTFASMPLVPRTYIA